jgi:hypothetical protein
MRHRPFAAGLFSLISDSCNGVGLKCLLVSEKGEQAHKVITSKLQASSTRRCLTVGFEIKIFEP